MCPFHRRVSGIYLKKVAGSSCRAPPLGAEPGRAAERGPQLRQPSQLLELLTGHATSNGTTRLSGVLCRLLPPSGKCPQVPFSFYLSPFSIFFPLSEMDLVIFSSALVSVGLLPRSTARAGAEAKLPFPAGRPRQEAGNSITTTK